MAYELTFPPVHHWYKIIKEDCDSLYKHSTNNDSSHFPLCGGYTSLCHYYWAWQMECKWDTGGDPECLVEFGNPVILHEKNVPKIVSAISAWNWEWETWAVLMP